MRLCHCFKGTIMALRQEQLKNDNLVGAHIPLKEKEKDSITSFATFTGEFKLFLASHQDLC